MLEQRNLLLAVVLSVAIILGFQFFFAPEKKPIPAQDAAAPAAPATPGTAAPTAPAAAAPDSSVPQPKAGAAPAGGGTAPSVGATVPVPAVESADRRRVLAQTARVRIDSDRLQGSIALTGGRIDDLILADYRVDLDPDSDPITLLSPPGVPAAYYAEFGWVGDGGDLKLPNAKTRWQTSGDVLAPGKPVTLTWDNGQGLLFSRILTLDENYLFTVTQRIENKGAAAIGLFPYGLVSRTDTPEVLGFYILHEGPLGVFDGTLKEIDYEDLKDDAPHQIEVEAKTGWIGITDKYWLVALLPDPKTAIKSRFLYEKRGEQDKYQVDYLGPRIELRSGGRIEVTNYLFTGAKEVNVLDAIGDRLGIDHLDKSIDFGWFYFLTKPLFKLLIVFNDFIGNMGLAILLLTVLIKIIFFPLANKSYRSMSKMKALQPEMLKLRERFSDDKSQLNQEMMGLYKRHKVTPAAGCLPMVIQIPVFFALYKVLFVTIEMRQAPFFGWIKDLSVQDPTTMFNLFGLIPWDPTTISDSLMIGIWPLLMGLSMFMQQRLNPQPPDPLQAKIFMFLPLMFTVMLARFPAGLVIYWFWNNILSIAQQWVIMKKMGVAKPAS